jgi:hypothetical protein
MKINLIKVLFLGCLAALFSASAHAGSLSAKELPACTGAAARIVSTDDVVSLNAADACVTAVLVQTAEQFVMELLQNDPTVLVEVAFAVVEVTSVVVDAVGQGLQWVVDLFAGADEQVAGGDQES